MRRFFTVVAVVIGVTAIGIVVFVFLLSFYWVTPVVYEPCPIWRISQEPADRAFSTLNDSRVTLMPSKVSFAVPKSWLDIHRERGGNLAFSPEQIESVANGTFGNLEFEFASVANAIFPFDRCAAYIGSWKWNTVGGDQLRVYDLAEPLDEVIARIEERGTAELQRVAKDKGKIDRSQYGKWSRIKISFVWGTVDASHPHGVSFNFYAQQVNGRTIVLCLLGTQVGAQEGSGIVEILNSVDFPVGK